MSMMEHIVSADVFVTSVQFSETNLEIAFLEHREQGGEAAMMRTMMLDISNNDRLRQAYLDLQEMLCDVVDEGYFMIRESTDKPSIREQMLRRRSNTDADDDAEA